MPQYAHYGWIPDLPDQRDYQYAAPLEMIGALPASVDLTSACPPVYDQGQLGSCTANAIGGAIEFDQIKQNLSPIFVPSRLFIYYNERSSLFIIMSVQWREQSTQIAVRRFEMV